MFGPRSGKNASAHAFSTSPVRCRRFVARPGTRQQPQPESRRRRRRRTESSGHNSGQLQRRAGRSHAPTSLPANPRHEQQSRHAAARLHAPMHRKRRKRQTCAWSVHDPCTMQGDGKTPLRRGTPGRSGRKGHASRIDRLSAAVSSSLALPVLVLGVRLGDGSVGSAAAAFCQIRVVHVRPHSVEVRSAPSVGKCVLALGTGSTIDIAGTTVLRRLSTRRG